MSIARRVGSELRTLLAAIGLLLSTCGVSPAAKPTAQWPQWRGPNRDCSVSGKAWPESLSGDNLTRLWQVPLDPSYSGPIVVGDRVYVTETQNRQSEVVKALDRATGSEIWQTRWTGAMSVPFYAKANGDWIRSTPAFDEGRLYVAGMRDVLVCLDADSGEQLWRADFTQELGTPLPSFGFVASPLIVGDAVVVQAAGGIVSLDKRTGQIKWRTVSDAGDMSRGAFSSPVATTLHGREQLVVQTRQELIGLDLKSGDELWSVDVPAFRGMNIVTPTVVDGAVFTSSYGGGSFLFDLQSSAGGMRVSSRWQNRAQGYMSSPAVIDDSVYLHLRNQRFACIDLKTGDRRWTSTPFGKYWSMAVQGDRILVLDERGDLLLIRTNPDRFELVDSRHVSDDPTWAHLAVCGNEIFVRSLNSQMAFSWRDTNQLSR